MKWYIGLGVICVLLVICTYNMYNGYEQKDIEIETGLLKVFNESKLGREKQDYDYIEILMRTEEELMKYKKKIKLNKYTSILFFLWSRNEKVYWLIYIIIITESVVFILVWIEYITNVEYIFKILFRMYIYIFLIGGFILVIKVLKKRVKDFISGKIR